MDWRELLKTLQGQFEAKAAQSRGLHHLFVEVADHERDRAGGPGWFERHRQKVPDPTTTDPWEPVGGSTLPTVHPRFRELAAEEVAGSIPEERLIRDGNGRPQAVFEPLRLRFGYLCGNYREVGSFNSLAESAARVLTGAQDLAEHEYTDDLIDLFRQPVGGIRYIFGAVPDPPREFTASGWNAGRLIYPDGVLIDLPIAESEPGVGHWLLLLHRLSWRGVSGSPLKGQRLAWHENTSVPFDWVRQREFDAAFPQEWKERFAQIPITSYYSVLGDEHHPLDVFLASSFAIQLLLAAKVEAGHRKPAATPRIDYSNEEWSKRPIPPISPGTFDDCRKAITPRILLVTATQVERDAVLRYLDPPGRRKSVLQVFHGNNTFFVGRLGCQSIVLCMSEMGSSGRDAALAVASEAIRDWQPQAVIMVGIAFGRDPERQKIGDVLVADRVIAYEPQRVGQTSSVRRGHHPSAGPLLLNRFRNAVGWSFLNPGGLACNIHFGPVLSGEKLVDHLKFKASLFADFPNAVGGEMEGAGLAAAADRARCEWGLVKGICDWADGNKDSSHQSFAAAAAVSLLRHVLSQQGSI